MSRAAAELRRPIRSFVHRARSLTKARKQEFKVLWEHYGRTIPEQGFQPEALFSRTGPITLEIGFGHGEVLLHEAQTFPQHNVLGIEVYRPVLFSVLREAEQLGIDNVRMLSGDAALLLPRFPDHCLQRIRILFPDPGPSAATGSAACFRIDSSPNAARCLVPGGLLHLATDWSGYAKQIEQVVANAAYWHSRPDVPDRPKTHFEQRGLQLGHKVWERVLELRAPRCRDRTEIRVRKAFRESRASCTTPIRPSAISTSQPTG